MKEIKYSLKIHQGIFDDKTYGVYVVPNYNENIEYQVISRLESVEEAQDIAKIIIKHFGNRLINSQEPIIISSRKNELDSMISDISEEKQEKIIIEKISETLPKISAKQFLPFSKITRNTPHLLSILALAIFYFNFSFDFPKWIPVLSDYISGSKFDKIIFAKWFPFLILISIIIVQIITRIQNAKFATFRDNILCLSIKYNWRREKFSKLFIETLESSNYSWIRKLSEWMYKLDSDSLKEIIQRNAGTNPDDLKSNYDVAQFILDEDFEARIHALYFMEKEKDFASSKFSISPFFFLLNNKRIHMRTEAFYSYGMIGFLKCSFDALPSKDKTKQRRNVFLFSLFYELLLIGGALIWSFILNPWNSVWGCFGMILI